jgi:hypothetical protein
VTLKLAEGGSKDLDLHKNFIGSDCPDVNPPKRLLAPIKSIFFAFFSFMFLGLVLQENESQFAPVVFPEGKTYSFSGR